MTTAVEIANAYVSLGVRMPGVQKDIASNLRKAEPQVAAAGRDAGDAYAGGVERSSSRLGSFFGNIAKAGVAALGAVGVASATVGIRTAAGMETAEIAFTTMLGSGEKAQAFLSNLSDFAAKTPFDLPGLQRSAQSLISIGIDANKVIPIMTTLGNVTSGMGTGAEGVQRATVAIQQMNAAGRITAEDLNQLRDAGVPVFDLLTAATGRTTEEIAHMAQNGKLGREELEQLMTALETGKGLERFNGMMEQQSQSLSGLWSTLKDTFSVGMAEAIQPLIPMLKDGLAGAITLVGQALPHVQAGVQWLVDQGPAIATFFGNAWQNAVDVKDILATGFTVDETLLPMGLVDFLRDAREAAIRFWEGFTSGEEGGDPAGTMASIASSAAEIAPVIGDAASQLPSLSDGLTVVDTVFKFLADNAGLLAAAMPLLVGGFIAFKAAQVANDVIGRNSALGMGLQITATLALASSNRALAASNLQTAGSTAAATAAETVSLGTRLRLAAATVAQRVATTAAATAAKVAAGAQWLLNAAMSANPIGLIVAGIAAVVAALVWFFTQTELGRGIWETVTAAIATAATWLWENVLSPVFTAIGAVFTWIWENIISPIGTLIVNYFRFWGAVAVWLWENVLSPVFAGIGQVFSWIWSTVIEPIVGFISLALQGLGIVFDWLYKNIIKPVWEGISSTISAVWNWIDQNVFTPFKVGVDLIAKAFEGTAEAIGTAWDGIKAAAATPINFVLDTVWNNGLRSFWNDLVGTLGLNDMKLPKADLVKFADGGVEKHVAQIARGGEMRLWAEPETGGEAYIPLSPAKRARSTAILATVANEFGYGLSQYASGGIFGGAIDALVSPAMSGANVFGKLPGALLARALKTAVDTLFSFGGGAGGGNTLATVKSMLPAGLAITSTYRTPAENRAAGGAANSLHMDRANPAVDIAGSVSAMNRFALTLAAAGPWRELLYNNITAPGIRPWPGHSNHIHVAANGGIVPGTKLYDQGGWLPHGGIAMNMSGRPEPVLTDDQWAAIGKGGEQAAVIVHGDMVTQDVPSLFREADKYRRRKLARTVVQMGTT